MPSLSKQDHEQLCEILHVKFDESPPPPFSSLSHYSTYPSINLKTALEDVIKQSTDLLLSMYGHGTSTPHTPRVNLEECYKAVQAVSDRQNDQQGEGRLDCLPLDQGEDLGQRSRATRAYETAVKVYEEWRRDKDKYLH